MTTPAAVPPSSTPTPCPVCASAGRPMFPLHTWSHAATSAGSTNVPGGARRTGTDAGGGVGEGGG